MIEAHEVHLNVQGQELQRRLQRIEMEMDEVKTSGGFTAANIPRMAQLFPAILHELRICIALLNIQVNGHVQQ